MYLKEQDFEIPDGFSLEVYDKGGSQVLKVCGEAGIDWDGPEARLPIGDEIKAEIVPNFRDAKGDGNVYLRTGMGDVLPYIGIDNGRDIFVHQWNVPDDEYTNPNMVHLDLNEEYDFKEGYLVEPQFKPEYSKSQPVKTEMGHEVLSLDEMENPPIKTLEDFEGSYRVEYSDGTRRGYEVLTNVTIGGQAPGRFHFSDFAEDREPVELLLRNLNEGIEARARGKTGAQPIHGNYSREAAVQYLQDDLHPSAGEDFEDADFVMNLNSANGEEPEFEIELLDLSVEDPSSQIYF